MTCKLMAGDKVLYELEYYSVGGGFIEWKGYQPPKKGQPKYPYATMKELRKHAEDEQALDRAGHDGERGRGLRQVRGRDQRLPRQDRRRHAGDREVGPRPSRRASCQARSSCTRRRRPSTRGPWTTSTRATAPLPWSRPAPWPASEENARGHLVITAPTGGSAGVMPAIVYALVEGKRKLPTGEDPPGPARGGGDRLPGQAQRDPLRRRGRLPGRDRRRLGHVRGLHRAGVRLLAADDRERRRVGPRASPRPDLRPGRRLRPGALHRTLRLRRREGVDRVHDREQRDRDAASRRPRHDDRDAGRDGEGHGAKYKETSEGGLAANLTLC